MTYCSESHTGRLLYRFLHFSAGLDIGQFRSWAPLPEPEGDTATAAGSSAAAYDSHSLAAGTLGNSEQHSQGALRQPDHMAGSPAAQLRSSQPPAQPGSMHSQPVSSQAWGSPGGSSRPAGLSDIDLTPIDSDDEVCPGDTLEPGATGGAVAVRHPGGGSSAGTKQQQQQSRTQLSQIDLTPLDDSGDDVRPGASWVLPDAGSGGVGGASQQEPASQQSVHTALNEQPSGGRVNRQETAAPPEHEGATAPQDRVGQKRRRRQPGKIDFVDLT